METQSPPLHVYFLPHMAPGHMIPMVDMARQFARRGVKATILATPLNATQISNQIQGDVENGSQISIKLFEFPSKEAGLPEGCENMSSITTFEQTICFFKALDLLHRPVERLAAEDCPDCIVAPALYTWANDLAAKSGIPWLNFWGTGFFPLCAMDSLRRLKPYENMESDSEEFIIPELPGDIKTSKQQLPVTLVDETENPVTEIVKRHIHAEERSYGIVVNSFYELEPEYARHYREVIGRKAWHVGPFSLCNKENHDKVQRGQSASIGEQEILNWLDSKKPKSVVYICFGSMIIFSGAELQEMAMGLEASGQQFIWVVKQKDGETEQMPEGFEKRIENQGLIIRGWAPQLLILDHEAVGGFVTHCGWNSMLEGVAAGVPMVTWPLSSEQFFNEKLVTQILKIGVPVGVKAWTKRMDSRVPISRENIKKAVEEIMVGEAAEERRSRAIALGNMAKKAVETGGSSHADFSSLLEELRKNNK